MIDFLFFLFWSWNNHSSWLLAYLPAISLKAAAAEREADLTRILFSHNSHHLFWATSALKVYTNERTSWIGSVRWGRQCWGVSGQFLKPFQRHVLKCDAYITHCMHAHSFIVIIRLQQNILSAMTTRTLKRIPFDVVVLHPNKRNPFQEKREKQQLWLRWTILDPPLH